MYCQKKLLKIRQKLFIGNINKYAKAINAKIYNASEVSFIDAFERVKIANIESNLANN